MHLTIPMFLFAFAVLSILALAMTFRIPSTSVDYSQYNAIGNFDLAFGTQVASADGAITIKEGNVFVTKGSAAALTLAAPTAGAQSAGGDDGRVLRVTDTAGYAHTVTTPANKLNKTLTTVTFDSAGSPPTARVGSSVTLVAYNGVWYATTQNNVTLS